MEIVYHLGAHCTDEDRIPKILLKNRAALADEGIEVPWPRQYRYLYRNLLQRLSGKPADRETQDLMLDAVMVQDAPRRVIFSDENYLCPRNAVLGTGQLYPGAGERIAALRNIFPDHPVSFAIALRNPATLLPALLSTRKPAEHEALLVAANPAQLRWSEMVARMRAAAPDSPITVWCNEDTPVLWPVVLRAVAGHSPETVLAQADDFLATLMTEEGMQRMRSYFADHPTIDEDRRRRAVAAFFEKFGIPDEIEMELDLPGWTVEFVEALSDAYDDDMAEITRIPGVTLIG